MALLLVLAALTIEGCAPAGRPRLNVLFITVDTLRADRLGCYGCPEALTPAADRLAMNGTIFTNAIAPVPRTSPSVASLLTGLPPSGSGVRGHGELLGEPVETYPEIFRKQGYRAAAVVTNYMLKGKGFGQGFEPFIHTLSSRSGSRAEGVTDLAIDLLDTMAATPDSPFFLWVHYLDPHWPYDPPPYFADRFIGKPRKETRDPFVRYHRGKVTKGEILFQNEMSDERRRLAGALYDGEIAYADRHVARLLDRVAHLGLEEETIIVFTSDHGESMG